MALLSGAARSASAQATTAVRVLQLRKEEFDSLLASNVDVMKEMLRVVAQRTTASNQRASQEANVESGKSQGVMTVVFSPRGGSGRSTIATNLAIALAQTTPDRVVLFDLDLLFGQATVMLNVQPRTTLGQATASALKSMDRESFNYYLTTHEESSLRVLVAASRPEEGELVSGDHVRAAVELLRRQFVHIIVDCNGTFSDANLAALELADRVLMVSTPEFTTLRDVRECQRIFHDLLGFPRQRFMQVLNHPFPYKGVPSEQVSQVLEAPIAVEIPFGSDVPAQAALHGVPFISKASSNPAARALHTIARDLDRVAKEALALAGG
jgi:pilus assembly protein CpaE